MQRRLLQWLLVVVVSTLGLITPLNPSVVAQPKENPTPPLAVIRLAPVDELLARAREIAQTLGQEELLKQFEGMLKARTGPKGIEGLDPKKPIGLYGAIAPRLPESQVVLMLPIADSKAFLGLLENLDMKAEALGKGLYKVALPNTPAPAVFRFEKGYLFGTLAFSKEVVAAALNPAKLPLPEQVLVGQPGEILSVTLNLDRLPSEIKDAGKGILDLGLGQLKDMALPNETPTLKALRETAVDQLGTLAEMILNDAGALKLKAELNKNKEIGVAVSFAGKPGTVLAKEIANLSQRKSVTAGFLTPGAALRLQTDLGLTTKLQKVLEPVIEDFAKQVIASEQDANKRELLKELTDSLKPTARAGTLDMSVEVRGPIKEKQYTLVMGMHVKDGANIEAAVKKILAKSPAKAREVVNVDIDKVENINIHRVNTKDLNLDKDALEMLGDGPFYFAVRGDALIVTLGPEALTVMKTVLKAPSRSAPLVEMEMSLSRFVPLNKDKEMAALIKKVMKPGEDQIRVRLVGGDQLRLEASVGISFLALGVQQQLLRKE